MIKRNKLNLAPFCKNNKAMGGIMEVKVVKVIDGDTFKCLMGDEIESIRMYSINTPELNPQEEPCGKEAYLFTLDKLQNAKHVYIMSDATAKVLRDTTDQRRILAWVFVDDELLNLTLVEKGLASVVEYQTVNQNYLHELYLAYNNAKLKRIGIHNVTRS